MVTDPWSQVVEGMNAWLMMMLGLALLVLVSVLVVAIVIKKGVEAYRNRGIREIDIG
jgi:ABC-type nickel/cobalt efflux system permease component RcnA